MKVFGIFVVVLVLFAVMASARPQREEEDHVTDNPELDQDGQVGPPPDFENNDSSESDEDGARGQPPDFDEDNSNIESDEDEEGSPPDSDDGFKQLSSTSPRSYTDDTFVPSTPSFDEWNIAFADDA